VFFLICVLIGLIAYHVNEYYAYVRDYNNDQQRLIGFQNPEAVAAVFNPLREELIKNRRSNLTQFPSDLNRERIDERIFTSPDETKGKGITYLSFPPVTVNYGGVYFPVKNTTQLSQRTADEEEKVDRFVTAKLFDDLVDLCKQNRCNNYETYNDLMWRTLFTNHENKNLGIGKIYIASKDNLAVFPQGTINPFQFEGRPWWQAANGVESQRDIYSFSSSSTDPIKESGVTKVYPDIVSEHNITDLTRTIFFKFNAYKKDYIFAVDVRLNPTDFKLWDRIWYEIILLGLLLLTLPVLIFLVIRHKYVITSPPPLVYKLQRIDRQKASYRANQKSEYKLAVTQSVRKTEENIARIRSSNVLSVDAKLLETKLERVDESSEGTVQTELIEIKVEKTIDLSLKSGNLKTFELWRFSHPNNEKYVLGLIEVLWQNNRSENEITFEKYFWDSNTSASFDLITKELKKHLHTTENDTFLFDQSSQSDAKPDIVGILKDKLAYVKDFANKSESFNNRVLLFDDNAPILKQLYSGATKIFATCSIEFLDYLKSENRLEDILGLHLEIRYIIDGENRKFKDYYKELNEDQKQFFSKQDIKDKLKIIEYRPSQEVIYQNRDFCIVSFGNDKCVLYTDMNNAKRGWISWREVDIGYYEAIEEFIKSGGVGKSDLDIYLKNHSVTT
jgi:hypothetical protein